MTPDGAALAAWLLDKLDEARRKAEGWREELVPPHALRDNWLACHSFPWERAARAAAEGT